MAADHIGELASMENSNRSARPGFCSDKYSLLVIVGQPGPAGFVDVLVSEIERGVRSWDVDLTACNIDEQLKLFISRHSACFSEDLKGKKLSIYMKDSPLCWFGMFILGGDLWNFVGWKRI
ncbi:hypothetical protein PO909_026905 [Leuciscus waleckii]